MSRTATIDVEVSSDRFRAIELEAIGHLTFSHPSNDLHRRLDANLRNAPPQMANEPSESLTNANTDSISKWRATIIVGSISGISLIGSMLGGIIIVALPTMARDLGISDSLLLWPASVSPLACGCTLLISGSISDVVGSKKVYLVGEFMLVITTIASGVCRTGIELILFRAASGVALSLCLPSSVSLITSHIPSGTYRNVAFACLGAGQPLGFSVGLVIGGVFVQSIGWRVGYYIGAGLIFITFLISIFGIPADRKPIDQTYRSLIHRLKTEIDWLGCFLLSTSLGLFSYVFAILASGASHFIAPVSLTLFSLAVLLLPAFILHGLRQECLGLKTIIPPSIWKNSVFTCLCVTVFVIWGVFDAMQYFLTLFFQEVQSLSPIQTSLRFLPMVVTGSSREYVPISSYVLFTVANLVITSLFPGEMQGIAGGVFNTISDIGASFGLGVTAVVASSVTMSREGKIGSLIPESETLMDGYRATFWLCFGVDVLVLGNIGLGLRKIGKVGLKEE
ncbi:major facilitator superfamily domain-containing protein [Leptodontidium sp. MPI-SDFR-AT-0119]|nr:major facilitator superfamily domain-containing protein [Leptodontidium sp. MPI-SDFR-AT-0119]